MRRVKPVIETSEITDYFELDLALEDVEDDSERETPEHIRFNISFYGVDYPVESIVLRMGRNDFFIPNFQRSYVWSQKQASRFIESLLYGLPVPGIFLYREPDTGRHLIVDGQQRLKTLQFFYNGIFGERKFRLLDVALPWRGRTYTEWTRATSGDSMTRSYTQLHLGKRSRERTIRVFITCLNE
jgi:hypothetical protein